jgi:diguanylate cyclase (GGDEF)-like protein
LKQAHANLFSSVNELRKRESDLRLLAVLGEMLQSCHTTEEARSTVPQFLPQIFPDYSGSLLAIKESRNLVEHVAGWGDCVTKDLAFPPSDCWALRRGATHVMEECRGPRCKHSTADADATICIPMMAQGDAIGVLHMIPNSDKDAASRKQIPVSVQNLAKAAADQIALALTNIRFREALQNQSIRDPLTTLFNRRYMEESLERELHRAQRNSGGVAVIMVDLDHFKSFNDMYGHRVADNMLRVFARYLQRSVRLADIVCRYGGEEFVLILPATTLEEAINRLAEVQEGARRLTIEGEVGIPAQITFSAGIAVFPLHGADSETLLRGADRALYDAKQRGRDRISVESNVPLDPPRP